MLWLLEGKMFGLALKFTVFVFSQPAPAQLKDRQRAHCVENVCPSRSTARLALMADEWRKKSWNRILLVLDMEW